VGRTRSVERSAPACIHQGRIGERRDPDYGSGRAVSMTPVPFSRWRALSRPRGEHIVPTGAGTATRSAGSAGWIGLRNELTPCKFRPSDATAKNNSPKLISQPRDIGRRRGSAPPFEHPFPHRPRGEPTTGGQVSGPPSRSRWPRRPKRLARSSCRSASSVSNTRMNRSCGSNEDGSCRSDAPVFDAPAPHANRGY